MSGIVVATRHAVPAPFVEPKTSPALAVALDVAANYPRDLVVSNAVRTEAERLARQVSADARPIGFAGAMQFLAKLNFLVGKPLPAGEHFESRAKPLAAAVADYPAIAFTESAMRQLAGEFFPGLKTIEEALAPVASRVRSYQRLLTAVEAAPGPHAPVKPASQVERDRIVEAFRPSYFAVLPRGAAVLDPPERPKVKPAHLSGDHLAAARAAAVRR